MRLSVVRLCLPLFLVSCGTASSEKEPAQTGFAGSARAIDGDTLSMDFRLLGIDAPEKRQLCGLKAGCWPCGKAAQDFLARALRGSDVQITLVKRRTYGRQVATAAIAGEDLGDRLIAAGLAIPQPQYLKNDPERAARYETSFAAARATSVGMHQGRWIEPARWRRGERLSCERSPSPRG